MKEVVIVGAGPYGLSVAAHFRAAGIPFRIFGRPMDGWRAHMPKGMLLKSDGFASNLADPRGSFSLAKFCSERGIEYSDTELPIRLETFVDYGLEFQRRLVPEVEDRRVNSLYRTQNGFELILEGGELISARRVVLATGLRDFSYIPATLAHLPPEYLSHSGDHHDLEPFRGRRVVVIGGGASAVDLAGLLYDAGAEVQLIARQTLLKFHGAPVRNTRRSWYKQFRHPKSGIGPGWRSRIYTDAPLLFHWLPPELRLLILRTHLGPAGGWFAKDKVVGRVPLLLGHSPHRAEIREGYVRLMLKSVDAAEREVIAEHIIAATGYKVNINKMSYLSEAIKRELKTIEGTPILSGNFESSVPGMYFAGLMAASSFGPMLRFVYGARFSARRISRSVQNSRSLVERPSRSAKASMVK